MRSPGLRLILGTLVIAPVLVHGCARTPAGTVVIPRREMTFQIEFNAPINEAYYYFIVIDTVGGEPHPTPVFPSINTGERWVTRAATHFVQYYQGQYNVYRIKDKDVDAFETEPMGSPVRFDRLNPSVLRFTLDLNALEATGESVDVNIITTDQLGSPTRFFDALGQSGTDFLEIGITSDHPVSNTGIEPINDILGQDEPPPDLAPLDIKDFTITVDV